MESVTSPKTDSHVAKPRHLGTLWPYMLLGLLILGPLLKPGYILTLDMAFTPHLRMPASGSNSYLFYAGLHWLNLVIPADWLQKLLLLAIFVMAGLGMHRLILHLKQELAGAAYLGGLLYVANPFVYDRFMVGQYGVLAGYALLPWFTRALLRCLAKPVWRRAVPVAIWAVALSVASIHAIVPMAIIAALAMAWRLWQLRADTSWDSQWQTVRAAAGAAVLWLLASSYWLVPLARGTSNTAQAIDSFGGNDRLAFATVGQGWLEQLGNVLGLQGFWGEARLLYTLPQERTPVWGLLMVLLIILVAIGLTALWRQKQRGLALFILALVACGAVLGAGFGNDWLAGHIHLLAGYREPQKLAMMVAFGYAVGAACGAKAATGWLRRHSNLPITVPVAWAFLALLPVLTASTLFWGGRNQLRATAYPQGWYSANRTLNSDTGSFNTLFLPWHLYMYADFAGRIIANPAPNFFDKPIISSDDPELGGVAATKHNGPEAKIGAWLLTAPQSQTALGDELATIGVKYVMVAHASSEALRYGYLDRQSNITLVADYGTLRLYRNNAYESKPTASSY